MRSPAERPRVGISRCLLGEEVRHDGSHRRNDVVVDGLSRHVDWVPVGPEVEIGMGTPREPIQLVARPDGVRSAGARVRLLGVHSGDDWTDRMAEWARDRVQSLRMLNLSGFILKARSPSCGFRHVTVHQEEGDRAGRGLFAQALVEAMPDLPIEDEDRLADPWIREEFLRRLRLRRNSGS